MFILHDIQPSRKNNIKLNIKNKWKRLYVICHSTANGWNFRACKWVARQIAAHSMYLTKHHYLVNCHSFYLPNRWLCQLKPLYNVYETLHNVYETMQPRETFTSSMRQILSRISGASCLKISTHQVYRANWHLFSWVNKSLHTHVPRPYQSYYAKTCATPSLYAQRNKWDEILSHNSS